MRGNLRITDGVKWLVGLPLLFIIAETRIGEIGGVVPNLLLIVPLLTLYRMSQQAKSASRVSAFLILMSVMYAIWFPFWLKEGAALLVVLVCVWCAASQKTGHMLIDTGVGVVVATLLLAFMVKNVMGESMDLLVVAKESIMNLMVVIVYVAAVMKFKEHGLPVRI